MSGILPEVYLTQHGETAWSLSGQATGRTDIPLTHRGERDGQELGTQLQGLSFVHVLTSPLQRARRTAVLAGFDECAQPDPDLLEWDYGAYEGREEGAEHGGPSSKNWDVEKLTLGVELYGGLGDTVLGLTLDPDKTKQYLGVNIQAKLENEISLGIGGAFGLTDDSEDAILRLVAGYEFE